MHPILCRGKPEATPGAGANSSIIGTLTSAVGAFSSLLGVKQPVAVDPLAAPEHAFFKDFNPDKSRGGCSAKSLRVSFRVCKYLFGQ